jgi:dipeptidyl aminopeptidase/acylaminoacyl peptidase
MSVRRWVIPLILAASLLAPALWQAHAQDGSPALVVFSSSRSGNYEIYALDLSSGQTTQLTDSPASDVDPALSPDGNWIVFASDRSGNYDLYLMRVGGSGLRQLTTTPGDERQPRWLDATRVVYAAKVKGQWDLFLLAVNGGGDTRQLTDDTAVELGPDFGVMVRPDAVVNVTSLNVRANPGAGASLIEVLAKDTPLKVTGRLIDNSWVQVTTPTGESGWVLASSLKFSVDLAGVPVIRAVITAPLPTPTPTVQPTIPPTASAGGGGNPGGGKSSGGGQNPPSPSTPPGTGQD